MPQPKLKPALAKIKIPLQNLLQKLSWRPLKKLFERGKYSDKYIKKTVWSNDGYKNLPTTSPGFEDL